MDLGSSRIGVAVCDEMRLTVRPLGVIEAVGAKRDAKALRSLLEGLDVKVLVVGLPLRDDREETAAIAARERGLDLARRVELPVEFVDEAGTTIEAAEILRARGLSASPQASRRPEEQVDAIAAALILEAWLAEARQAGAGSPGATP